MKRLMTSVVGLMMLLTVVATAAANHVPANEPTLAREATLGFPKIMLSDTTCFYTLFAHIVPPDSPAPCEARDTIWIWNAGTDNLHFQLNQSHLPRQTYAEFITPLDSNVILPHNVAAIEIQGCHDGIGGSDYTDKCVYSVPGEFQGYLEITSNDPLDSVVRVCVTRNIPNPMLPSISVGTDDVFYTHFPNLIGYSAQTFCGGNPPIDIQISCGEAPTWYPYFYGGIPFWTTTESDSCVITLSVTDQLGRTASATTYVKVVRQYNGPVWYVSLGGDDQTGIGSESKPFRTLQMGITTANPGDTVSANSGVYSPVVIDKPLTLLGRNGSASTEIVGLPNTRCVFVNSVVDTVAVDGFTLRNGSPSSSSVPPFGQGGGLLSVGSNVRIANCVVTGNSSNSSGGGLAFRDSSYFEIINTRISVNSALQSGGGIVAIDAKGCKIHNTIVDSNEAYLNGGGVFVYSSSVNPAKSFELKNCVIAGNTAHEGGTGIGVRRNSLSLSNCIVYANHAATGATNPSGVYVSAGSLSLHCTNLYGNEQADLFTESISDSSGNISVDPLFCDPMAGDFHVSRCSPCVPANNVCGELIGSYGAGCDSGCPPGSLTWHVAVDGSDLTGDGTSAYPLATIQRAIDLSKDGDTVLVAPGTYSGEGNRNILVLGKAVTVKSDIGADSTIISCQAADFGFHIFGFTPPIGQFTLDGFTITGASDGMWIHTVQPSTIRNCSFLNCSEVGVYVYMDGNLIGFEACKFAGNKLGLDTYSSLPMVSVTSALFDSNETAMHGNISISNSTIKHGKTGFGGGWCSSMGSTDFSAEKCLFEGIEEVAVYATVVTSLKECTFKSNPGLVALGWSDPDCTLNLVFDRCTLINNGGGIVCQAYVNLSVHSCLVAQNRSGINFGTNPYDIYGRLTVSSSTIVDNDSMGLRLRGLLPTGNFVTNNIIAGNHGFGVSSSVESATKVSFSCNDVFGNQQGDYLGIPDQTGANGNISLDPRFCDTANGDFQIQSESPCAPSNNSCGVLIGALGIGCLYGDADGDGSITVADAVFLVNYIFIGGPAPEPISQGDSDCSGDINIADAVYLIAYIFSDGPAPCSGV